MALFQVRRSVAGAEREDIDAGALRALMCAMEFPNMRWVRTYWDRQAGVEFCLFEAERPEHLREHARRARIPDGELRPVQTLEPQRYLPIADETQSDIHPACRSGSRVASRDLPLVDSRVEGYDSGMPLFHVRRDVPGAGQEEVDASAVRALICATEFEGLQWIESQWDAENGVLFCLYEADSREQVVEHARRSRIPCDEVHEVVTVRPEEYVIGAGASSAEPAHS
jgi:hypothetical protein